MQTLGKRKGLFTGGCLFLCLMGVSLASAYADDIKIYSEDVEFAPFETDHVKLLSVTLLSATDDRFGGLSGLLKTDAGYIAVSDRGTLFRFDGDSFQKASVIDLLTSSDVSLSTKRESDAEGLAAGPDGTFYVSFERDHRIVPYRQTGQTAGEQLALPQNVIALPKNGGLEAIETLRDGRLVLLGEGKKNKPTAPLWVQHGDKWQAFHLKKRDGFRPTGLTRLPGSDQLILLERFYQPITGVRVRLSYLDVQRGTRGVLLAELGPPMPIDNFEGITAYLDDRGRVVLTLISDDNFSILQRTLVTKLLHDPS
ncbi:esterase-like activity of phytase family protein [Terasakiella sp. A23]|uniref:esterase-like activity of phytase family protein n=1 Tax=Terasakiella sp. FCG-A23 TaxID=3080561 RepID=UPI0029533E84|nr:esterase-like activity of phytase family protein [Terasakiella sp. A23]MDV7341393.1 esterase-like activity of phytase family protein [Terasakiella sp. A23]